MSDISDREFLARGWSSSANLAASIITGLLLGLALDTWLGTRPVFVVVFVVAASIGGFYRVRGEGSRAIDEQAQQAIRIRDGL